MYSYNNKNITDYLTHISNTHDKLPPSIKSTVFLSFLYTEQVDLPIVTPSS